MIKKGTYKVPDMYIIPMHPDVYLKKALLKVLCKKSEILNLSLAWRIILIASVC